MKKKSRPRGSNGSSIVPHFCRPFRWTDCSSEKEFLILDSLDLEENHQQSVPDLPKNMSTTDLGVAVPANSHPEGELAGNTNPHCIISISQTDTSHSCPSSSDSEAEYLDSDGENVKCQEIVLPQKNGTRVEPPMRHSNAQEVPLVELSNSAMYPNIDCKEEYLEFSPYSLRYVGKTVLSPSKSENFMKIGWRMNMSFKLVKSDTKLIKTLLHSYGFMQVSARNPSFNLLWTGGHLRSHILRSLQPWQRVNHFPRSSELTRKDRLYENVARAQRQYGSAYDFIPEFYVTPRDLSRLSESMLKNASTAKDTNLSYIVKPVCASRGRGIFFATKPDDIPLSSSLLVSRYIDNPLLVNGHKFDLRVYVAVTSFYPLICYIYSEGLTRFASEKYAAGACPEEEFVHLTNYSVNKNSKAFVRNDSFSSEDIGHKWTLGALLRHLEGQGIDSRLLMVRIEDLVIKSLLSAQSAIAAVCKTNIPSINNSFELFGFDVLVDANLKPWLLEVNLSPSLSCDAPLDSLVKSRLICDLFNLACIPLVNRKAVNGHTTTQGAGDIGDVNEAEPAPPSIYHSPRAPSSRIRRTLVTKGKGPSRRLLSTEIKALAYARKLRTEFNRRGGFVRVFPRKGTMSIYGPLMDRIGMESWDKRMYNDEFVDSENSDARENEQRDRDVERDEEESLDGSEDIEGMHDELINTEKYPSFESLSPRVQEMLQTFIQEADAYLEKISRDGEKYMAKLPSVRASARLRTKSCNEFYELRAAKLNDDVVDMVHLKDRDTDSGVSSDGKENAVPPITTLSLTSSVLPTAAAGGRAADVVNQLSVSDVEALSTHYLELLIFEGLRNEVNKRNRKGNKALEYLGFVRKGVVNEPLVRSKVKYLLWRRQSYAVKRQSRRIEGLNLRESERLMTEVEKQRRHIERLPPIR